MYGALACASSSEDLTPEHANHILRKPSAQSAHALTPQVLENAELVERIRQDDGRALEELTRRYFPRLRMIAYAILGSDDLVQDVVQEVMIALWEQRARLDPAANIGGYLSRTVRNRALDLLQHERVVERTAHQMAVSTDAISRTATNSAETTLRDADVRARVYAALRHVPPSPREVFLLFWEHDLTYAEIAATLDISVANVRQQMHRAVQRLAGRLLPEE